MEKNNILLEWIIAIGKRKKIIIYSTLISTVTSILYSLYLPPIYTAKTTLIPNSLQSGTFGAVSGIGSFSNIISSKSQDDLAVSILNSDALLNILIDKYEIQKAYGSKTLIETRIKLRETIRIFQDKKTGLINIEIDSKDPQLAADLANSHIEILGKLQDKLSYSALEQKINFYQKAIDKVEADLTNAEIKFRAVKEKSGVLSLATLTENVYSQISQKELLISAMSRFSTNQNPEIKRIEAELSALKEQVSKIENARVNNKFNSLDSNNAINIYREIKVLENILAALIMQFKSVSLELSKSSSAVQQLDVASIPEIRAKPERRMIVQSFFIIGILLGLVFAIITIQIEFLLKNIEIKNNLDNVINAWLKR